jgi:hypothetical protein
MNAPSISSVSGCGEVKTEGSGSVQDFMLRIAVAGNGRTLGLLHATTVSVFTTSP